MKLVIQMKILTLFRLMAAWLALGGTASAQLAQLSPPKIGFDQSKKPPAPDYNKRSAWAVWPGVPSRADIVPKGSRVGRAGQTDADVFFIHPTTYLSNETWNARFNEGGFTGQQLDETVLGYQVSAFNACCRMFVPRYRQATISAFLRPTSDSFKAYALAYSDVQRAFNHYLKTENRGRPFILASHSQGSLHATRLIHERIDQDPALRRRLVVAYVVGASLPTGRSHTRIPVCSSPRQTGCLVDWNSASRLTILALGRGLMVTWADGRYSAVGLKSWLCVNPLSWRRDGRSVPASANTGALPFPGLDKPVPALRRGVTGAQCRRGRVIVKIGSKNQVGFTDALTRFGSFHNLDYSLFYQSIRQNAVERVAAFLKKKS